MTWLVIVYLAAAAYVAYRAYQKREADGWQSTMAAVVKGAAWPVTVWKVLSKD